MLIALGSAMLSHYVGTLFNCDSLRAVVRAQQKLIDQIEQVNPDGQNVYVVQNAKCPEKADILIDYPSHQNRLEIEELIGGDTFYGVPYRLRNY